MGSADGVGLGSQLGDVCTGCVGGVGKCCILFWKVVLLLLLIPVWIVLIIPAGIIYAALSCYAGAHQTCCEPSPPENETLGYTEEERAREPVRHCCFRLHMKCCCPCCIPCLEAIMQLVCFLANLPLRMIRWLGEKDDEEEELKKDEEGSYGSGDG